MTPTDPGGFGPLKPDRRPTDDRQGIQADSDTRTMLAARVHAIVAMLKGAGDEMISLARGEDAFDEPDCVDDLGDPINLLADGLSTRLIWARSEVESCLRVLELCVQTPRRRMKRSGAGVL